MQTKTDDLDVDLFHLRNAYVDMSADHKALLEKLTTLEAAMKKARSLHANLWQLRNEIKPFEGEKEIRIFDLPEEEKEVPF